MATQQWPLRVWSLGYQDNFSALIFKDRVPTVDN